MNEGRDAGRSARSGSLSPTMGNGSGRIESILVNLSQRHLVLPTIYATICL